MYGLGFLWKSISHYPTAKLQKINDMANKKTKKYLLNYNTLRHQLKLMHIDFSIFFIT